MDNQSEWSRRWVVSKYGRREGLMQPESVWLSRHGERLRGARILDLGVGCGRTSPHLLRLSSSYVGVDYSGKMIACARRRIPGVDFRVGDARALEFPDASFDLVVFSFNGIDMVDRTDRFRVLNEVRRTLKPSGAFLFSSHNLERAPTRAYDPRQITLTPNPLRMMWRTLRFVRGIIHHLERRDRELHGEGWAILNDKANNYRLLTYYVSPRVQAAELAANGFVLNEMLDDAGANVDPDRPSTAKFIYYSATKVA